MLKTTDAFLKGLKPSGSSLSFPQVLARDMWEKSALMAAPHVKRLDPKEIFKKRRPSEDPQSLEYRQENYCWHTREGFEKFVTTINRTLTGVIINDKQLSDKMREYWNEDESPYYVAGQYIGWKEYFFNYVVRTMLAKANDIEVHIPYRESDPERPPFEENRPVDIMTRIIPISDINVLNKYLLIFFGGKIKGKSWYWVCDKKSWYKIIPKEVQGGGVKWILRDWYDHNTGTLPVQKMPGAITEHPTTDGLYYNESYISTYFELGTDFINRSSDEMVSSMKSTYEVRIYRKIDCPKCDGTGLIMNKEKSSSLRTSKQSQCPSCQGDKKIKLHSPFQDIVYNEKPSDDRNQPTKASDIISAYRPDVSISKNNWETAQAMYTRMMNSIGLELVSDSNASGEAKKVILQQQEDIINTVAAGLIQFINKHAWHLECLLNPVERNRVKPKVILNDTIKIKDISALQKEVTEAIPINVLRKTQEFIQHKYRGDENEIRRHRLMLKFEPSLVYNLDQVDNMLASGRMTNEQWIRYSLTPSIFYDIEINPGMTDAAILKTAEKLLSKSGAIARGASKNNTREAEGDEDGDEADGLDEIDAKYLKYESGDLSREDFSEYLQGLGFSKSESEEAIGP